MTRIVPNTTIGALRVVLAVYRELHLLAVGVGGLRADVNISGNALEIVSRAFAIEFDVM